MKQKKISKNYVYNILYEILVVIVPLITTPYISRVLGVEGVGIYSYTFSIATYFTFLAALGTTTYARREIAYIQDDPKKRSTLFWEIVIFRILATLLSTVAYIATISASEHKMIAIIQTINIIAIIFDVTWFFQGMEEFGKITLVNGISKIFNVLFIFMFVKDSNDLDSYSFGLAFLPLLGNIISWIFLIKHIRKVKLKSIKPLRHFKGAMSFFIPTIAAQVYLVLDKTMIGFFTTGNIENGYYEQAQKIIKICWTFLTTIATVMAPRIAFMYSKKRMKEFSMYLKKSFKIMWLISSAITFGLLAISSNLVPWFFGDEYMKVSVLLVIFAWILYPIGLYSVIGSEYLIVTNKMKPYTLSIIIGASVNFLLNLFLITRYYSVGAAIASVIAEIIVALVQFIYVTRFDNTLAAKDIFDKAWKYVLSGVIMFCITYTVSGYLTSSIINTILLIAIGATVYVLSLITLRDEITIGYIKKYANLIKKGKN